ncbi:MAG: hypothetical protein CAPSK01_001476 [Candidatus Accumulibacter vicinus]|uniref:Uncharacterized protein n=1 Tax=Candidatus Accumulibacter vicinus TaxID=2954382 RepID=A0A084Y1M9_9PROT|nr:MAG: hypothetical protein CAPSK01_001476 [Candidatus Accumulibacter vicinus]
MRNGTVAEALRFQTVTSATARPLASTVERRLSGQVLLVENHAVNQLVAQAFLEAFGLQVSLAAGSRPVVPHPLPAKLCRIPRRSIGWKCETTS